MQRISVVAEIFGYLVCLVAVVVFFISVAGIVNGAFRVAHPTPVPGMMVGMAPRPSALSGAQGPTVAGPQWAGADARRAHFVSGARYDAVRRLVLSIVMLIVAIVVFRRSFDWVSPRQIAGS